VQRGEADIARSSRNERLRAAYRHIEECLEPVASMIEAFEGDTDVIPGATALVTGGHTADHQVIAVRSRGECFIHLADIAPTRSHIRGPWNQSYDLDALRTMEQKASYLEQAVAERWWVSFAHDERVFAAQIVKDRGKLVLGKSLMVPEGLDGV
jgi:glyoxylase-like metal-dependent hydrolase (beta-lactamase superfamily II)